MKKQYLMTLVLVQAAILSTWAYNTTRSNYINRYSAIAVTEMQRSKIPASITLAQGILESASGQSELAKQSNNHFGIKCKSDWTGPTVPYEDDDYDANGKLIKSCFRAYKDPHESYKDHTNFLVNSARYASLFELHPMDYIGWAKGLKSCGYATAPNYAEKLIRIIEENKLYMYDVQYIKEDQPIAASTQIEEDMPPPMVAEAEVQDNEEYLDMVVPSKVNRTEKPQKIYTEIHTTHQTPDRSTTNDIPSIPAIETDIPTALAKPMITKPFIIGQQTQNIPVFHAPRFDVSRFRKQATTGQVYEVSTGTAPQGEMPSSKPDVPSFAPGEQPMAIPQRKNRGKQSKRSISLKHTRLR